MPHHFKDDNWLVDILAAVKMWRVWVALSWHDILTRYRRSAIGPFWLTLSLAIFVGALGVLYSTLFRMEIREYMPFITAGFITWTFISSVVNESSVVFVEGDPIIKHARLPLGVFVLRMIVRNLVVLLHNLPVLAIVFMAFGVTLTWVSPLAVLGFCLLVLNAIWIGLFFGVLGTRFRDLTPLLASGMQIIFFVTPIFWSPSLLSGKRRLIADWNPMYHMVEVVRAPLLGQIPSYGSYFVVVGCAILGSALGLYIFGRFRRRIPYWL